MFSNLFQNLYNLFQIVMLKLTIFILQIKEIGRIIARHLNILK